MKLTETKMARAITDVWNSIAYTDDKKVFGPHMYRVYQVLDELDDRGICLQLPCACSRAYLFRENPNLIKTLYDFVVDDKDSSLCTVKKALNDALRKSGYISDDIF